MKPNIALVIGDPAGVGPELVVAAGRRVCRSGQCLRDRQSRRVGRRHARDGIHRDLPIVALSDIGSRDLPSPVLVDWPGLNADGFERGQAKADNGKFMLDMLTLGARLTQQGATDALCFAPLKGHCVLAACSSRTNCAGSRICWLPRLYRRTERAGHAVDLRVTSHVALRDVSGLLTPEGAATQRN